MYSVCNHFFLQCYLLFFETCFLIDFGNIHLKKIYYICVKYYSLNKFLILTSE